MKLLLESPEIPIRRRSLRMENRNKAIPIELDITSCLLNIPWSSQSTISSVDCSSDEFVKHLKQPPPKSILLKLGSSSYRDKTTRSVRFADGPLIDNAKDALDSLRVPNNLYKNINKSKRKISVQGVRLELNIKHKKNPFSPRIISKEEQFQGTVVCGLCPYCKEPNFLKLDSFYVDHMLLVHGIFENGKFVPSPFVSVGSMQHSTSKRTESFQCLSCPYDGCSYQTIRSSKKGSGIKAYKDFFEHISFIHRNGKRAEPRPKIKEKQKILKLRRESREKRAQLEYEQLKREQYGILEEKSQKTQKRKKSKRKKMHW